MPKAFSIPRCPKIPFWMMLVSIALAFALPCRAATALDHEKAKGLFLEGEFNQLQEMLERHLQQNPNPERQDRIFAYKYLSVVYAADPSTKKKAESYMYQLLRLVPTIELLDMYVSDQVSQMFHNVKEKFHKEQSYQQQYDEFGNPKSNVVESSGSQSASAAPAQAPQDGSRDRRWIIWAAGGAGAVALAVTTYVVLGGDEAGGDNVITLDPATAKERNP